MKKLTLALALVALAALGLAACGGGSDSSSTTAASSSTTTSAGGGATLAVEADPNGQLAYTKDSLSTTAGDVTVDFNNPSSLTHDVVIEDADGNEIAATNTVASGTASTDAKLETGTYTYFCSVDGHRAAGMEGTLTVK
jgi:plastocyanin